MFRVVSNTGGFSTPINKLTLKHSQAYKDWFAGTRNINVNNFNHVKELLGFAHELLGKNLESFIQENYKKGVFGPLMLDFMLDTLAFAHGGTRNMELAVAARLLDENIPPSRVNMDYFNTAMNRHQKKVASLDILVKKEHSIYLTWTRNKNGIDDLANTLAILFT